MQLLISQYQARVVVMIVVEHVGYGGHERIRQVIPIASSADQAVHPAEQLLPPLNDFRESSGILEKEILHELPL